MMVMVIGMVILGISTSLGTMMMGRVRWRLRLGRRERVGR
jgi:hypothetical protein